MRCDGRIIRDGGAAVKRRLNGRCLQTPTAGAKNTSARSLRGRRLASGVLAVAALAACGGGSVPAATTSAAATSSPAASPPPGGPAPALLIGRWTRDTPTDTLVLTLTATTYTLDIGTGSGGGAIVVNGNEIDFFSSPRCLPLVLPEGVGRYQWTLQGHALHLAPLNADPCGRVGLLTNQTFTKSGG